MNSFFLIVFYTQLTAGESFKVFCVYLYTVFECVLSREKLSPSSTVCLLLQLLFLKDGLDAETAEPVGAIFG